MTEDIVYEFKIYFEAQDASEANRITDNWLNRIDRHHWWAFWRRKKCEWGFAVGPWPSPDATDSSDDASSALDE